MVAQTNESGPDLGNELKDGVELQVTDLIFADKNKPNPDAQTVKDFIDSIPHELKGLALRTQNGWRDILCGNPNGVVNRQDNNEDADDQALMRIDRLLRRFGYDLDRISEDLWEKILGGDEEDEDYDPDAPENQSVYVGKFEDVVDAT